MMHRCPYPDCDWQPSRSVDSDCRLTQVVVAQEIREHREEHREDRDDADRQSLWAEVDE